MKFGIKKTEVGDVLSFYTKDGFIEVEAIAAKKTKQGTLYIAKNCYWNFMINKWEGGFDGTYDSLGLRLYLNEEVLPQFPDEIVKKMVPFDNGDLLDMPGLYNIVSKSDVMCDTEVSFEEADEMQYPVMREDRRYRIAMDEFDGTEPVIYFVKNPEGKYDKIPYVTLEGDADEADGAYVDLFLRPIFILK